MTPPEFLDVNVVLFVHDQVLRDYGGIQGLKDEGLLDSALNRPVNKFAYADPGSIDLFDMAAAYAYGLAKNHAFNDANKRTAWGCCVLFLKVNGIEIDIPAPVVIECMPLLASNQIDEAQFARLLRGSRQP